MGSLRKELQVKTLIQAVERWFEIEPEIFNINPIELKNNLLTL